MLHKARSSIDSYLLLLLTEVVLKLLLSLCLVRKEYPLRLSECTYDVESEEISSHDGCYDVAKDGEVCMKHEEEDILRQWFRTLNSQALTSDQA